MAPSVLRSSIWMRKKLKKGRKSNRGGIALSGRTDMQHCIRCVYRIDQHSKITVGTVITCNRDARLINSPNGFLVAKPTFELMVVSALVNQIFGFILVHSNIDKVRVNDF